jgi:hypothetical protein
MSCCSFITSDVERSITNEDRSLQRRRGPARHGGLDFAPDKEAWVASYSVGKHFEARLAHVHGNLFALLNLALGFVLVRLATASDRARTAAAGLGLAGLLMPAGILGEVYLGLSPIFVLLGAVSMTASVVLTGVLALKHWGDARSAT